MAKSVLDALARISNQMPPRLKALLNLFITLALVAFCVPFLWRGFHGAWSDLSLGLGLFLLGVFNLFT